MKRLLILTALALPTAAGVALAAGDAAPKLRERPPWSARCVMEIRAYEDASANLYCEGRRRPFGAIDAESGRVRFFVR